MAATPVSRHESLGSPIMRPYYHSGRSGNLDAMGPISSLDAWGGKGTQAFHEHGTFFAIWLLVIFAGVEVLTKARVVLEPLLWAFFIVMGLVPLTDIVENCLFMLCRPCGCRPRKRAAPVTTSRTVMEMSGSDIDEGERSKGPGYRTPGLGAGALTAGSDAERVDGFLVDRFGAASRGHSRKHTGDAMGNSDGDSEQLDSEAECGIDPFEEVQGCAKGGCIRTLSVVIVILLTIGFSTLFFGMVYKSALHMQESWSHYQNGAQNISDCLQTYLQHLPSDVVDKLTRKALVSMEAALVELINGLLESTSHAAIEIVWILLYMIFWLCQPVHIGKDVSAVFRRYIFLKGLASGGYALCIWLLLYSLSVDLSVVFGLVTFVLNFIPEVGPFIAMMLPLPVVLFDDRIEAPMQYMVLALVGQLALKVVWGNIVEIKLIESQQEMKMHPVVILFFVAFFQYVWGATGMLLSVPIVAALKATLHKLPPAYRNPILVFLEGDTAAPAKWKAWRASLQREDSNLVRLGVD